MILDFADPATPAQFEADVVIAGSGPAAISLAKSVAGAGRRVLMLEAGNVHFEEESQELYKGRNLGWDYPIQWSRLRQFGGTSGHWTGQCGRLRPSDMAGGPDRPSWPIPREALLRWYTQAAEFLEVSSISDDEALGSIPPGIPGRQLLNHIWHAAKSDPVRLADREGPVVGAHKHVDLLVHAAVTGITDVNADGTVGGFRFRTRAGRIGEARGRHLVLACGGIENARLLEVMRRAGLPIDSASALHIGRYMQEHPNSTVGVFAVTHEGRRAVRAATKWVQVQGGSWLPAISTPASIESRSGAGGCYFRFSRIGPPGDREAFETLPDDGPGRLRHLAEYYDEITHAKLARRFPRLFRFDAPRPYRLFLEMEQQPDQRNRVSLGPSVDAIGLPVVEVDMQVREADILTMRTAIDHLARVAIAEGLGRVALDKWTGDPLRSPDRWGWSWHHNGTTRMARRAADGVVDPDQLVFGTRNLHVAGASVFPTSGFVNPTLTIVAMSLRLAEILKDRLKG